MKKITSYFLGGILLLGMFYACKNDDDDLGNTNVPAETVAVNKWIKDNMESDYYWYKQLPTNLDYRTQSDPEAYFKALIYSGDKYSVITHNPATYSGSTSVTMGYYPTFYQYSNSEDIFMVVNYVYSGSAAEEAGLKRGDIIMSINGTGLNKNNYWDLYTGSSYTVQMGEVTVNDGNSTISKTNDSRSLTARSTTIDPAIFHDVLDIEGHKVGYLVYVEFENGDNNEFLTSLDAIFAKFKSESITDLVVDFRYNPGGYINVAIRLASLIAPSATIQANELLVTLKFNDKYNDVSYNFENAANNVNMSKVYFLTTTGTASASELVMCGLYPYMKNNVVQIGEHTEGKYYAASEIDYEDAGEWIMSPIVATYSNAEDFTNFDGGLVSANEDDIISDQWLISTAAAFGDYEKDELLAKAVEYITGLSTPAPKSAGTLNLPEFKQLKPPARDTEKKQNLYLTVPASNKQP